jgi:hypothetical protein
MTKTKTLTVMDMRTTNGDPKSAFKVVKLQNSVYYTIGEYLSKGQVDNLCKNGPSGTGWVVNIIPFKR